jgi:hypothetical protein
MEAAILAAAGGDGARLNRAPHIDNATQLAAEP